MLKIEKNILLELLHVDILTVTFIKKNGEERVMRCTLREDILPPYKTVDPKKERKVNEDIVHVYDVDVQGFRSFRLDSIKQVQSSPGDNHVEENPTVH